MDEERQKESPLEKDQNTAGQIVLDVISGAGIIGITAIPVPGTFWVSVAIEYKTKVVRRRLGPVFKYLAGCVTDFSDRLVDKYIGDYSFVPEANSRPEPYVPKTIVKLTAKIINP